MYTMSNKQVYFSSESLSLDCVNEHRTKLPTALEPASLYDGGVTDSQTLGSVEFSTSSVGVELVTEDRERAQRRMINHPARDPSRGQPYSGGVLSVRGDWSDYNNC